MERGDGRGESRSSAPNNDYIVNKFVKEEFSQGILFLYYDYLATYHCVPVDFRDIFDGERYTKIKNKVVSYYKSLSDSY